MRLGRADIRSRGYLLPLLPILPWQLLLQLPLFHHAVDAHATVLHKKNGADNHTSSLCKVWCQASTQSRQAGIAWMISDTYTRRF